MHADEAAAVAGTARGGWMARLRRAAGGAPAMLREHVLAERERWALWVPALLGCGIGLYFMLLREPPPWLGAAAAAAAALATWLGRRREALRLAGLAGCLLAAGFAAAQLETGLAAAPALERRLGPVRVEGRILEIDPLPEGARLIIAPTAIPRLAAERLPARLRVTLRRGGDPLLPGDQVAVTAILYPPPAPAMPGAYDFQRRAFFDRLGAVGYAVAAARRLPATAGEGPAAWRVAVAALRSAMTERIMAALPGPAGGVAAAIITGQTHAIPEADAAAFRDAGLAHILVIAGLHMGMVAGLAFGALRAGLALVPALALRYPTKKWAAAGALLVTFGYMLLSGATVSSRRSFIMTGLMLLAVLVDRLQLSARGLAYAATAILLLNPVALTGPSFQMSFAAVGALIAFYEAFRTRLAEWHGAAGPLGRIGLYALGIALTTVICTVATAPFTIFHFNRFAVYSVAANIVAVPITGFWVMPWAMVACLLMPLGLETWALQPMGSGIAAIIAIARMVTAWPGATVTPPAMPLAGLMLVTSGGLWLVIWQRRWRLWGALPIAVGLAAIAVVRPPDLIIAGDARLVAARAVHGQYLLEGKMSRINLETWTRRAGGEAGIPFPRQGRSGDGSLVCDALGCTYRARGRSVALPRDPQAIDEDCRRADLVVSRDPVRRRCHGAAAVIDFFDLWRKGAHAVWLDPAGITIETVDGWRGERPWVPRHLPRAATRAAGGAAAAAQDTAGPVSSAAGQ